MKCALKFSVARAFTLIELMVIIFTLAMLMILIFSGMANGKFYAQQKVCSNNLKQIGLGFRIWAGDSRDKFHFREPIKNGGTKEFVETEEVFRHFQVMSNELQTPKVLICPTDSRQPAVNFANAFSNTNISYFVGVDADESNPEMLLSGDLNVTNGFAPKNNLLTVLTNQTVGWSHIMHKRGGSLLISDGHAEFVTTAKLREALQKTGTPTNRLAIP